MIRNHDGYQWNLSYASLLTSCSNKIWNCKCQITDLSTQVHDIFNILIIQSIITLNMEKYIPCSISIWLQLVAQKK